MNIKSTLLALCAFGLAASANAQISVGFNDLVLGFNKTSGTGSTNNLEVSLGSVSNFKAGGLNATGAEVFLSQLSVADLNANFGIAAGTGGWQASGTNWAVVGTNGAGGGNTLWGTYASGTEAPGSSQGAGANAISTMYSGLNGQIATANSASSAFIATAEPLSWKTTSDANFSYWSASIFRAGSTGFDNGSIASTSLNFYEWVEGAASATLLGQFKLYNNGNFSFTSAAVIPEPSTYAALLGVATMGIVAIRRRRQAAVEA